MTNEEAIKELQWVRERGFVADIGILGTDRIVCAVNMAIEALKKQIPQAVDIDFIPYNNTEDSARVFICPECTEEVEREWDYCPECGQHIDWSEEEE